MNDQLLFERLTGAVDQKTFARLQTAKLLRSFRSAPHHRFDGGELWMASDGGPSTAGTSSRPIWAHQAGVNALALERFDGRILISGGSDGTIRLWDLEHCGNPHRPYLHKCIARIARAPGNSRSLGAGALLQSDPSRHHIFGVTHLSFYPFDQDAFLSSSYDQSLKVWATQRAQLSGSFDLSSKVYMHASSPIASHLLVACATSHPAVRLVDLRSGAAVRSLIAPGQIGVTAGAVLSVAWAPHREHVLASGAADGTVRIWDVRSSNGLVTLLDQEDSLGIVRRMPAVAAGGSGSGSGLQERGIRASAKAHTGPVNGLAWTDDGDFIISAGHDRRIRVWDAATGANTLVNFGPTIRNGGLMSVTGMFTSPTGLAAERRDALFWPNDSEILVLDLHEGTIISRLRGWALGLAGAGAGSATSSALRGGSNSRSSSGERSGRNRVTSLAWRSAGGFGSSRGQAMGGRNVVGGVYSGHSDGQIRVWMPELEGGSEEFGEDEKPEGDTEEQQRRKRKVIDNAYRSLMGREIKFS